MNEQQQEKRKEFHQNLEEINSIMEALNEAGITTDADLKSTQDQYRELKKSIADLEKKEQRLERVEKEGCFVATAVYESYEHPSVLILRKFRDFYLLKRRWGIAFVNLYYKHGPKLANQVKKSSVLKFIFYMPIQTLVILLKPHYKDK